MVYLIHFERPYRHARHYTGFARDAETFARRIEHHRRGSGARLMQVVTEAGIGWKVVKTWADADRDKERKLKRSGGASRYCPVCRKAHAA